MVKLSKRANDMSESSESVRVLFNNMACGDIISLGGGAPAAEALPVDEVRQIVNEVITKDQRGLEALQYGPIQGVVELREQIIRVFLQPKGIKASVDDILIGNGGLEGLYLLSQVILDPGDVMLVESPTFIHAKMIFDMVGAQCIPCVCDEQGFVIEDVEAKILKYHPKMVYVTPTFHNPTGKTFPADRRKALAELGSRYDVIILEDDPYEEIRYSGEPLPPIKSFDRTGNTVYATSFSKNFAPGFRLGYVVADPRLMYHMVNVKIATNSLTSMITQVVLSEYLKRGLYPDHLKDVCSIHRERRDCMLACIDKYFPKGTYHTEPDGGLYIWAVLPMNINTKELVQEAQERCNVYYVPGDGFFVEKGKGLNTMRLSYSKVPVEKIEEGMKRLGALIVEKMDVF